MDVWAWVEDYRRDLRERGQRRLASLMGKIPHFVSDGLHDELDAAVAEALALARNEHHAWAEVFVRHWNLSSRSSRRLQVGWALPEVVSLLELAHRPEAHDCPHRICVMNDLATAWEGVDAPGYAGERLELSRETLQSIDPTWSCHRCVATSLADAMGDAGEAPERILSFVDERRDALVACGRAWPQDGDSMRVRPLMRLGDTKTAVQIVRASTTRRRGKHGELEDRNRMAWVLAADGQIEEARGVFPSADSVRSEPGLYPSWVRAALVLVRAGGITNDWKLGASLRGMVRKLREQGCWYLCASIGVDAAELAVARGALGVARILVSETRAGLERLRRPETVTARIERLEAELRGLPIGCAGGEGGNPEPMLDSLVANHETWSPEAWAGSWRETLRALDLEDAMEPGLALVASAKHRDAARALVAPCASSAELRERWSALDSQQIQRNAPLGLQLVDALEREGNTREAEVVLTEILLSTTDITTTTVATLRLARRARERGDYRRALARLDPLVRRLPPGEADCERMIVAALAHQWEALDESARRLGMPTRYRRSAVQLRVPTSHGKKARLYAARFGPVTARIVQPSGPPGPERCDDLWVFDLATREVTDTVLSDGRRLECYDGVAQLEPGNRRPFEIVGIDPGLAVQKELEDLLRTHDVRWWTKSGFELGLDGRAPEQPGIIVWLAVSERLRDDELHDLLYRVLGRDGMHLVWLDLAQRAARPQERERIVTTAKRLGLIG